MSCYHRNPSDLSITIPSHETIDGITIYTIRINCWHNIEWTVRHRYRDFDELHERLVQQSIAKDLLPRKKMIGNKSQRFLEQRQIELQKYLQTIAHMMQHTMPVELVEFLEFHRYDVIFLLQHLAHRFFRHGEIYLMEHNKCWTFTILELHAIAERIRLPCPSQELQDGKFDFSHILDFCSQLQTLRIVPVDGASSCKEEWLQHLVHPIGTSNILPSTLTFDLSPFTNCLRLELCGIVPQNITKCGTIRGTIGSMLVNNTRVQNVHQILLCDSIHNGTMSIPMDHAWTQLKFVHLGSNDIWTIDPSMKLIPNVQELHLEHNRLRNVSNLRTLHQLRHLNLSGNIIESVNGWNTELGNVQSLNLSGNKIKRLDGLGKLRSIRQLDLSWNEIEDFEEMEQVAALPVLEVLGLNGNPLATAVDYRPRVMSRFGDRCNEITLDNEKCSPAEIDKALVLAALRSSKLLQ